MSPLPPLGAVYDGEGTSFAVYSRAERVELCLLNDDGHEQRIPLTDRVHHVWHRRVEWVRPGQRYGFRAYGPYVPHLGQRFDPTALLVDPYARAVDGDWSVVVDPGFDWGDDRPPAIPWADTVIYELHVKGFTRLHPAVPPHLRGTYAGLAHPDSVGHLLDLGVTTLELLPVQQFETEPGLRRRGRSNYWGYNTLAFFAPHAAYSASGSRGGQVREFQEMVRDLHRAGLEVVLDVVYNHTCEGGADGPTRSLRGLADGSYYRLRSDGSYDDVTGCGNSLDLTHPRCLALVMDSLRYWVQHMHVDGFRFDLTPTLARTRHGFERAGAFLAAIGQDPVLSQVKLIAEPWDLGVGGYQLGSFPPPWAEWNDRFRDVARASWLGRHGHPTVGMHELATRLSGSSDLFDHADRGPLASVNFVTAHDGFTLHDLVTYDRKHNEANGEHNRDGTDHNHSWNCGVEGSTRNEQVMALRRRLMRNLMTTLLVSTGVPMLTAGDETGRTQRGNNNAYCHDNELTWLSWQHKPWARDLYDWTRALLALRRSHRVLRHDRFFTGAPTDPDGAKDLAWFHPTGAEMSHHHWQDRGQLALGMYLSGRPEPGESAEDLESLLVLLNTGEHDTAFRLPGAPWGREYAVLLDTAEEKPVAGPAYAAGADVGVLARSVQILAVRR